MYPAIMERNKLPTGARASSLLKRVYRLLREEGVTAYLVGGVVRDRLLSRATADIDIALKGDARKIAPKMASALGGKHVLLDDDRGTSRIILPDPDEAWTLDFTTIRESPLSVPGRHRAPECVRPTEAVPRCLS